MRHLRNSRGMTDRLPAPRALRDTVRDGVAPEVVRVRLLGGFRVSVGSRVIREDSWRLRKAASLIKLLALAPGHRLHRERAMDLLWPDLGSATRRIDYRSNYVRGSGHKASILPIAPIQDNAKKCSRNFALGFLWLASIRCPAPRARGHPSGRVP